MSRWILLRHGRTARNAQRLLDGQGLTPLDYEGRWQAVMAGLRLGGSSPPPLLLCSDLLRAKQTAAALSAAAGWSATWVFHPALRERHLGRWQGRSYDAVRRSGRGRQLVGWQDSPPEGESLELLALRLLDFLAPMPDRSGIIVAHAGPLRVLRGLALGLPLDSIGFQKIPYASPMELTLPQGGWAALSPRLNRS